MERLSILYSIEIADIQKCVVVSYCVVHAYHYYYDLSVSTNHILTSNEAIIAVE